MTNDNSYLDFKRLHKQTHTIFKNTGSYAAHTLRIPQACIPLIRIMRKEENISEKEFSKALDEIFDILYAHPFARHSRLFTNYLRKNRWLPNEETTEKLIRYVVDQVMLRSPVAVPQLVVDEFWIFFKELFQEPEIKGLFELNLDISRLLLRTYEPLMVDIINLIKETRRANRKRITELVNYVRVLQDDLVIIRRQIRALRYIRPFFQTDPTDFTTQAKIVAQMVQEFGPFFIKMAQVAAANADFLPEEISKELVVFQDEVPPMSPQEVLDAFSESVGKSPYECYFGFDAKEPIKSGSIGSVFLAKKPMMKNGQEVLVPVVVKISRRGIDREFLMGKTVLSLAILSSHYWAPHSRLAPFLQAMQEQTEEFVKGFQRELDFVQEAENQRRFARRSKKSHIWNVPEVFFVSGRILEMEYVEGSLNIFEALLHTPSGKYRKETSRKLASRFLYTALMQILVYQEFHGDLHPGNILVNTHGELYLIDWGNCVNLEGKWKPLWAYIAGAVSANTKMLSEALINISSNPDMNRARKEEIENTLRDTLQKKNVTPLTHNFIFQLQIEGVQGLYRRMQVMMHLVSNTQQLGLVVQSEYLHLSRSLLAMFGTYLKFYEEMPKFLLLFDFFRTLAQFPLDLLKDRFGINRRIYFQLMKKLPIFAVSK